MKKIFCTIFILFLSFFAKAQYVNIPDDTFRQFLKSNYPNCFNVADQMDTICSNQITNLEIDSYITNWEGFQYFKNLKTLRFSHSPSNTLPTIPNSLKRLYIINCTFLPLPTSLPDSLSFLQVSSNFNVTSLPTLPAKLDTLICSRNRLSSLPILPVTLKFLECADNMLTNVPVLPNQLKYFKVSDNQLSNLPTLPSQLTRLEADNNQLSSIPSLPSLLTYLDVHNNLLSSLPALPSNLTFLFVGSNQLTSLPTLPAQLKHLDGAGNQINQISFLPNQLEYLSLSDNLIFPSLPALPTSLKLLFANNNLFTSIPALPDSLEILSVYRNKIISLPPFPINLRDLNLGDNLITNLPTLPPKLVTLALNINPISSLPNLPDSLVSLYCSSNSLSTIPSLPLSLKILNCGGNQLTGLPVLPLGLKELNCSWNQLNSLPALPTTLIRLNCSNNSNLKCIPYIPETNALEIIMSNNITCVPNPGYQSIEFINQYPLYYPDNNPFPLCNPTNNISQCQSFPVLAGIVFYDYNANGIQDNGELGKSNVKLTLGTGKTTITNSVGYYELRAPGLGVNNISISTPAYFNPIPTNYSYNFTNYDTMVTGNFALLANTTIDSLPISIIPLSWAAKPGFSFLSLIRYENAGTTTLSPTIVFNYDSASLNYDSSSNTSVVNNGNNLSFAAGNFIPGKVGSFIGYFRVKTTAVLGDSLFSKASISANNYNNVDSNKTIIRGAFDPNDKQATAELSPTQVASGKYIDYTIRFQNTGTDTAYTVVLSDTLSSMLQPNTLQLISSSHNCKTTVNGNIVFFEFLNILLPDKNVNELKSHGFVQFKIKPQANIPINSNIPNKAAIYFDYNSPIITNTAITQIKNSVVPLPLKLISFTAIKISENTASIFWTTTNEINVRQFIIEQSFDGSRFTNIGFENAKGRQYNNYTKSVTISAGEIVYYRMKMIDFDGQFVYSPVVVLRKNNSKEGFTILNNPVQNSLNISIQDAGLRNTTVSILNTQGMLMQSIILKKDYEIIDISKLSIGIYILQTVKGNKQFIVVK